MMRPLFYLFFPAWLTAQSLALTFDDGPKLAATPLLSATARNTALLKHLTSRQIQGMFFVTLKNGTNQPEGLALAKTLGAGGQLLANHTVNHPDFNAEATSLEALQQEVMGCDTVLRTLPGFRAYFRFPYLREGATESKREGIRTFLRAQGYRIGYVSIDTCDWLIDGKLQSKLEKDPGTNLKSWRNLYLGHLWERAQAYDRLARRIYGREIPHVLLLHHNLLNALFLGDVIDLFQAKGWRIVSPEMALTDVAYQVEPQVLPVDGSVLESSAKALGIPLKPFFQGVRSERKIGEEADKI